MATAIAQLYSAIIKEEMKPNLKALSTIRVYKREMIILNDMEARSIATYLLMHSFSLKKDKIIFLLLYYIPAVHLAK